MKNDRVGKICFVTPSLSGGGAERVVSVLAGELADQGYAVVVIKYFAAQNEYPVSDRVKQRNISNGDRQQYAGLAYKEKIARIRSVIKEEKPEYLVPFLPHVAVHVVLASFGLRVKVIQTVRAAPNLYPESRPL